MIIDARSVPPGTIIDTELCIVGAGAAGITLAREFVAASTQIVVLESGGMELDPDTQDLYEGQIVGQSFPDLASSRLRFFGGTTNHWGGWCLPFDEIDFEPRDDFPYHGWPFLKSQLDPFYARAQEVCRLGPYDYRPERWGIVANKVPAPFAGPNFAPRILQENPLRFGPVYAPQLKAAPRIAVYLNANAFHLDAGEAEAAVAALLVKTLGGGQFTVRARFYVLATGGIENARLLLASGKPDGGGLGNAHDLVGRYFMTHLAYSGGTIVPSDPYTNFDFQTNDPYIPGRYRVDRFLGITADAMKGLHLPNFFMGWAYRFSPVASAVGALKRLMTGEGPGGSALSDLSQVIRHLDWVADFAARKAVLHEGVPIEALALWCSSEQQPNPESRVTLGAARDRLGMREIVVDWRILPGDKSNAVATLRLLGAEIGRAGFGRLRSSLSEEGAWPADFYGNEHHMGTTRMHKDPTMGVVDADCRVHGMANLYVAGSSVFPTGGAYNPTLTIVALALRLADHLKQQLQLQ